MLTFLTCPDIFSLQNAVLQRGCGGRCQVLLHKVICWFVLPATKNDSKLIGPNYTSGYYTPLTSAPHTPAAPISPEKCVACDRGLSTPAQVAIGACPSLISITSRVNARCLSEGVRTVLFHKLSLPSLAVCMGMARTKCMDAQMHANVQADQLARDTMHTGD